MKPTALQILAAGCNGTLHGDAGRTGTQVSTDSRSITAGDVFVALKGDRFDGHSYLAAVSAAGAAAVVVSDMPSAALGDTAIIHVPDTLKALQDISRAYRLAHAPFVIGITGSSGKTSVKDMTISVFEQQHQVCGTHGNFNNHIGLPLSILRLREGDTCAVLEMGMNHPGEIAPLAAIALPDAAIITNVGVAHIEHMGSRAAIALEKGMLAEAITAQGYIVLSANDDFTDSIAARCKGTIIRAGIEAGDVAATNLIGTATGTTFTLNFSGEKHEVNLPILGQHMVCNAALAAAAGWKHGISAARICEALSGSKLTKGRLEPKTARGITFLDDSYNANPDSMAAGLRTLASTPCAGNRVAVLGRMGELGEHAVQGHFDIGRMIPSLGLHALFTVGHEAHLISEAAAEAAPGFSVKHFADHAECAHYLRSYLQPTDLVLLKGSRSAAMEKVLNHFDSDS
jgi:UDP-N-acetylmuramoyl-tripeptide--D-alanyl-D-alanine ligase